MIQELEGRFIGASHCCTSALRNILTFYVFKYWPERNFTLKHRVKTRLRHDPFTTNLSSRVRFILYLPDFTFDTSKRLRNTRDGFQHSPMSPGDRHPSLSSDEWLLATSGSVEQSNFILDNCFGLVSVVLSHSSHQTHIYFFSRKLVKWQKGKQTARQVKVCKRNLNKIFLAGLWIIIYSRGLELL